MQGLDFFFIVIDFGLPARLGMTLGLRFHARDSAEAPWHTVERHTTDTRPEMLVTPQASGPRSGLCHRGHHT